jgi:tetratricopeptide (TPR) repeat protein
MISAEFADSDDENRRFKSALESSQGRQYQTAFHLLQGSRGQSVANEMVQRAVLCARTNSNFETKVQLSDSECRLLEADRENWCLNPGILALGQLISQKPDVFGRAVLTTNFDPLLEIAIRRASSNCYRTILSADGSLAQTEADGCHVVHLHGFWIGSDTLHTNRQLKQDRPRLKNSLVNLLKNKVVLVCGYGGWDDVLTSTLLDIVRDDASSIEVLWALYGSERPSSPILNEFLTAGENRGRVCFYSGIDCNSFFPKLLQAWLPSISVGVESAPPISNPVRVSPALARVLDEAACTTRVLEGDDEDRPPVIEFCIGRSQELAELTQSEARVIFVTGIGGQGKSTLAASYYAMAQSQKRFTYFVWRDCKEEGERFENQIASVIESLSGGILSGSDLAKRSMDSLIDILLPRLNKISGLFVFDNVDHLVNLVSGRLTASADLFVRRFSAARNSCQIFFTCRPEIWQVGNGSLSMRLEGLTKDSCSKLFEARKAQSSQDDILAAHELTDGHAFWLDLLALQVVRNQGVTLSSLVSEIREGQGPLPDLTLQSVWSKLNEREHLVLRAMGETLRPETEEEIASYLSGDMTYQKVNRAMKTLRQLNLLVVKRSAHGEDLHELHPLVRQFVRARSSGNQRVTMIEAIFRVYNKFRGIHITELNSRPSFTLLQNWTQAGELAIQAGKYSEAIDCLAEARRAFESSAFTREFVRVVRLLLNSFNWTQDSGNSAKFDQVFRSHVASLGHLGLYEEVEDLLATYSRTVPEMDSRYILYCDMQAQAAWVRESFDEAIRWGELGQDLSQKSKVDTNYNIGHTLALARRDAGSPEKALPTFLASRPLAEILDPDELDEKRGHGPYYGNIGRCLHFMGQIRNALICYQKSALLIEKDLVNEHVLNQGYIRLWIGELLVARDQKELGILFLDAAQKKWEQIAPVRAHRVEEMVRQILPSDRTAPQRPLQRDSEAICLEWIRGRNLDGIFD